MKACYGFSEAQTTWRLPPQNDVRNHAPRLPSVVLRPVGTVLRRGRQYLGSDGLSAKRDLLGDRRRIDRDRRCECGDGSGHILSLIMANGERLIE